MRTVTALILALLAHQQSSAADLSPNIPLNHIQYIGTHNAYHIEPDSVWFRDLIQQEIDKPGTAEDRFGDLRFQTLAYTHLAFETQLKLGLRKFELDLWDMRPEDQGFVQRLFENLGVSTDMTEAPVQDVDLRPAPGLRTMHSPQDFRSTCPLFKDCLKEMKIWSEANPGHVPLILNIEVKGSYEWDQSTWEKMEAEVLGVLAPSDLVTPATVRGSHDTVREAVLAGDWPMLSEIQDTFLFVISASEVEDAAYIGWKGDDALFFVTAEPEDAHAAFVPRLDPFDPSIADLVQQGFMVSSFADWRTIEARANDTTKRDLLFNVGANLISTDFPYPDRRYSNYRVEFPDGSYVRENPVLAN